MHMYTPFPLEHAHFPIPPPEAIGIGSTIAIRDLHSQEVDVYTLVTPNRADIRRNHISSLTPVGRALYGRRVGETVDIDAPGGNVRFRIESHQVKPKENCAFRR